MLDVVAYLYTAGYHLLDQRKYPIRPQSDLSLLDNTNKHR